MRSYGWAALNLGSQLIHAAKGVSIQLNGDHHVGGGGDGRCAGYGECGRAVDDDCVVGVILRQRIPQPADGLSVWLLSLEQRQIQAAQIVVRWQYVQAPDAAVIQQVVVVGVRDGQQPGQGVIFPRREQGLGGVGLFSLFCRGRVLSLTQIHTLQRNQELLLY